MNNEEKILKKFEEAPNFIFLYNDFREIASLDTLRKSFLRLVKKNKILKISDGMFTSLKINPILNETVYPSIIDVAYAYARKFNWSIFPSGETALNIVGLSTQISNIYLFLTDGSYKKYDYFDNIIKFSTTAKRNIHSKKYECTILVIALNYLQEANITNRDKEIIKNYAKHNNIRSEDLKNNPYWMYKILLESEMV